MHEAKLGFLTDRHLGYSSEGPNCRGSTAIDKRSVVRMGFRQHVVCRHGCFFSYDTFLVQLLKHLLEKRILAFNSQARQSDNPCPWLPVSAAKAERMMKRIRRCREQMNQEIREKYWMPLGGG